MPAKKKASKKSKRTRSGAQPARFHGSDELMFPLPERSNGGARRRPSPYRTDNPAETPEERERRLAKRKALTLKAFKIAYENHHQRKES